MPLDVLMEEGLERRTGLEKKEISSPIKEEGESGLGGGGSWKISFAIGLGVLVVLAWCWGVFLGPHLYGNMAKSSLKGQTGISEKGKGNDSSFLHADDNLVKSFQHRLNKLGFRAGRVDGVVGPRTMEAIERFQSSQGIPVTGVIDRKTKATLESIKVPQGKSNPYTIARAKRENLKTGIRFLIDLSMDPALSRKEVERYIRRVMARFVKSNPDVNRFHVRGYLGIASLAAGAYAIANWTRKGENVSRLDGFAIRFQEWTRKDVEIELPPVSRKKPNRS